MVNRHGIFPTIFGLLREADPKAEIGCLYEWEGIKYLVDTLSLNYHAQAADYEKFPTALSDMAVKYIKGKTPNLLAVVFDNPDHVGHADGHDTPAYYAKLVELDGYIGQIVEAAKEAGIWDDTVIIISSDHGGIGKGHGGKTLQELETPFIIAGKNVKRIPEFKESMMQFDIAATIAYIFDLKTPQVWIGRPMKQVFK